MERHANRRSAVLKSIGAGDTILLKEQSMKYVLLRALEAVVAEKDVICLRDPDGYSDKLLFLRKPALFVCSLFDGKHSTIDIQMAFTKRFGEMISSEQIREIESKLDECCFLENERFDELRSKVVSDFTASAFRSAAHAGSAYTAEPKELRHLLGGIIGSHGESQDDRVSGVLRDTPRAIVAPHIDIARGEPSYAAAYVHLAEAKYADRYIVLGINHQSEAVPFIITRKSFETPLGTIRADESFIEALVGTCTYNPFTGEIAHRKEHSIEFQALFLRYLCADGHDPGIVPILCSLLFHADAETGRL
jgi:hypothetical protein